MPWVHQRSVATWVWVQCCPLFVCLSVLHCHVLGLHFIAMWLVTGCCRSLSAQHCHVFVVITVLPCVWLHFIATQSAIALAQEVTITHQSLCTIALVCTQLCQHGGITMWLSAHSMRAAACQSLWLRIISLKGCETHACQHVQLKNSSMSCKHLLGSVGLLCHISTSGSMCW